MPSYRILALLLFILTSHAVVGKERNPFPSPLAQTPIYSSSAQNPTEKPWRCNYKLVLSDLVLVSLFITAVAAYLFQRTTDAWPIWWYCLGAAAAIAVVRWVIRPIFLWWTRPIVTFRRKHKDGSYTEHALTLANVRRMQEELKAERAEKTRIRRLRWKR
ncbi:unnamed protein product, partial [Mesorhabditis spiculigera]